MGVFDWIKAGNTQQNIPYIDPSNAVIDVKAVTVPEFASAGGGSAITNISGVQVPEVGTMVHVAKDKAGALVNVAKDKGGELTHAVSAGGNAAKNGIGAAFGAIKDNAGKGLQWANGLDPKIKGALAVTALTLGTVAIVNANKKEPQQAHASQSTQQESTRWRDQVTQQSALGRSGGISH
jgi:hypothetical protein